MKKLIVLSVLAITFLLTSVMFAQPKEQRREMVKEKISERLNLTEEQQDKIDQLRINHKKEMIDLKAELEKRKLAVQELKQSDDFTRSNYLSAVKDISNIKNRIAEAQANHKMDVYELLDDNQKKEWLEMGDKMKHRMHKKHGERMKRRL